MCWSKRSPAKDEDSIPTTTRKPMGEITECPPQYNLKCTLPSSEYFCSGHGLCCHRGNEEDLSDRLCVCHRGYHRRHCEDSILEFSKDFERTTAIAAFSAVLGVIVITIFVALIVLQIKYYRRRQKRRRMLADDDHELDMISRPDASEKESKRSLITQPGYSWRESVRRTRSKASHKFRSTMSRSVPDDLFQVGLKLAIFGGCQPKLSPSDHQSAVGKAEVKAFTTQRCFSAGPDVGDGKTISYQKDNASASNRPIVFQIPTSTAPAATEEALTEDTVK